MAKATRHTNRKFPDMKLYAEIIFLQNFFKGKFVVENVIPYYKPLITSTKIIGRHLFWSNFDISDCEIKQPTNFIQKSSLEGKKELMEWLGIHFEEIVYYENNHCPCQILRNCVHPNLGLSIYNDYNHAG